MQIDPPILRAIHRGPTLQLGIGWTWSHFECDVPIDGLPPALDGLRILHLTDTHFRADWHPSYDRALEAIAAMRVDLIAFTGDWVEDKFDCRTGLATALRFARGLHSKLGTFSCLGNHDGDQLGPHLLGAGVHVLVGERRMIAGGDASIDLIGLPGVYRTDVSDALLHSFGEPSSATFRLLLAHYPDQVRRIAPLAPHLMLAGHTHGGQVCLPGGVPIIRHDSLPRHQVYGIHRFGPTWLHTSRGLGTSKWAIRAFCPPEMTVLTLRGTT